MSISINNGSVIAFKNLSGKSNTDVSKGIGNEAEGILVNVPGSAVWMDDISSNPATAVSAGVAVLVSAVVVADVTSNGHGLFANWPVSPPSGTDLATGSAFAYGVGSLMGISAGDRVRNAITPAYGYLYEAKPFDGANPIPVGDQRDWFYQYNSGVFWQQEGSNDIPAYGGSAFGNPTRLDVYVYIGDNIMDLVSGNTSSEWYNSVKSITCTPPGSPSTGDRYLLCGGSPGPTGAWVGKKDQIAEWRGSFWEYTIPTKAGTVRIDTNPTDAYVYSGTYPSGSWVFVPAGIVRVTAASGTDTYTSTVSPPISSYSNLVLISSFANGNTGASTMNVNGLGAISIQRVSSAGALLPLNTGDLKPGVLYMMVYNGSVFQLYGGGSGEGDSNWDLESGNLLTSADLLSPTPNVLPRVTQVQSLGSTANMWQNLYVSDSIRTNSIFNVTDTSNVSMLRATHGSLYLGYGVTSVSATDYFITLTGASGVNMNSGHMYFDGSFSTGTGSSGDLIFRTGASGSSGSTLNNSTIATRFIVKAGTGYIGINQSSPTANLHINGSMRYVDGNQAAGKFLVSDSSGNASWQTIPVGTGNVSGIGTTNKVTKWSNGVGGVISDSRIEDDGTSIGIGTGYSMSRSGEMVQANGSFASNGDAQTSVMIMRTTTTDATFKQMYLTGEVSPSLLIPIPDNKLLLFKVTVSAMQIAGSAGTVGDSYAQVIKGAIKKVGGVVSIVGYNTLEMLTADAGTLTGNQWTANVDNGNTWGVGDVMSVVVRGHANKTIRWVARVELTEIAF